jgi:hypothetical protein
MTQAAVKRETTQTTRVTLDWERWLERCVELAEQRLMTGTARYLGMRPSGSHLWKVDRRATGWSAYVVTAWLDGRYTCSCRSSLSQQPCSHIGAAWYGEQQREAAEHAPVLSEAYRWWLHTYD